MAENRRVVQPPYGVLQKKFYEIVGFFEERAQRFYAACAKFRMEPDTENVRISTLNDVIALYKSVDLEAKRMLRYALDIGATSEANGYERTREAARLKMSSILSIAGDYLPQGWRHLTTGLDVSPQPVPVELDDIQGGSSIEGG